MEERKCRVLVLAASRPRLVKVMGHLLSLDQEDKNNNISVEYLPCVASFDSYKDQEGKRVRYLISVNYHGADGTQATGSSLAPFFDEEPTPVDKEEDDNSKPRTNLGILGVAMGAGIETDEDVNKIKTFFRTLRGDNPSPLHYRVIQPNSEYASMKEETEAFKALSPEAKEEAALQQSIGPAKMAKFAHTVTEELLHEILEKEKQAQQAALAKEQEILEQQKQQQAEIQAAKPTPIIDPNKLRFACRKCRTVLFGEDDLQEHVPAQHKIRARKANTVSSSCQSYFLTDCGLNWMGDMSEMEGRFNCPRCQFKLGTWHWAGAQCSCGTWVSPAVQVPKSKVDELVPAATEPVLPIGTVMSPFVVQPRVES